MARGKRETEASADATLTASEFQQTNPAATDGNGQQANPPAAEGNVENTAEAAKRSGPRNRSDSEYWLVATDPMDGTSEFLLSEPTVGQGRKARVKMLRSPMARGRKIRLARVTYVEG